MKPRVPSDVITIAVFALIIAILMLIFGGLITVMGTFLSDIDSYGVIIIRLFGVMFLLVGGFAFLIGIGLLLMKDWARIYGLMFFKVMFFIFLLMFVISFLVPVCVVIMLVLTVLSAWCWMKLREPGLWKIFEGVFHGSPDWMQYRSGKIYGDTKPPIQPIGTAPQEVVKQEVPKPEIKIPDNMIMCPQCDSLNPKVRDICRKCGDLLPDE